MFVIFGKAIKMMYQFYIENLMFKEYGEDPYVIYTDIVDDEVIEEEIRDMVDSELED